MLAGAKTGASAKLKARRIRRPGVDPGFQLRPHSHKSGARGRKTYLPRKQPGE